MDVVGVDGAATGSVSVIAGAGSSSSVPLPSVGTSIHRISPISQRCTNGKYSVVPGCTGSVISIRNVCGVSSGNGPPTKVTTSPSTDAVHPSIASGTGVVTPTGSRMSSCTVGDPSQPCSTVNPTTNSLPAGASAGSGSMCANATDGHPHSTPIAPIAATTLRPRQACRVDTGRPVALLMRRARRDSRATRRHRR